jgi:hypothetical protein
VGTDEVARVRRVGARWRLGAEVAESLEVFALAARHFDPRVRTTHGIFTRGNHLVERLDQVLGLVGMPFDEVGQLTGVSCQIEELVPPPFHQLPWSTTYGPQRAPSVLEVWQECFRVERSVLERLFVTANKGKQRPTGSGSRVGRTYTDQGREGGGDIGTADRC